MAAYRHHSQGRFHTLRYGVRHFRRHHIEQTGHRHDPKPHRPHRKRRRSRRLVWMAVGLVVIASAGLVLSAIRSLESAKTTLTFARDTIEADLAKGSVLFSSDGRQGLAANLLTVKAEAASAFAVLHGSFGLSILGSLPLVSSQRQGMLQLVADVSTTASTASSLLTQINLLSQASTGTNVSLSALARFERTVEQAHSTIARLDRPAGGLLGPIGSSRRAFDREISKVATDLYRGSRALSYLEPFLGSDGPRTYLIAGENNAEMRDQGDVLSLALMKTNAGTFQVDTVGSVDLLEPAQPVDVVVPASTESAFGSEDPLSLWQSVNGTADFPFSARVMQAMFRQVRHSNVDGVIALDVPALSSLLELTGPVLVPGIDSLITAGDVGEVLLHQQYIQYGAASAQAQRHDNISAVAKAIVDRMKSEHIDLASLGSALATDVADRHLIVWDQVPSFESTVAQLGASGAIDSQSADRTFHVAVENSTATKLDYYITSSTTYRVDVTPTGQALVNTSIRVTNHVPVGQGPTYQTGPDGINSFVAGQYVGRVAFWSPRNSLSPGAIPESGLLLRQIQVSVLPGQSQTVTFATVIKHAVIDSRLFFRFVPQPRLVPESLHVVLSAPSWQVNGHFSFSGPLNGSMLESWSLTRP